jgi:hypothetical protein
VHQQYQTLHYPTNALNYIDRSFVKTGKCLKYFKKNCSNIFWITQDPSSGGAIQYFAKITNNGSILQVMTGVSFMAAYFDCNKEESLLIHGQCSN